jgi:hypothetical protein
MFKKLFTACLSAGALVALGVSNALAVPVLDLSGATTAITAELSPAIVAAMPVAGTLIAVGVGWKLFRRFVR